MVRKERFFAQGESVASAPEDASVLLAEADTTWDESASGGEPSTTGVTFMVRKEGFEPTTREGLASETSAYANSATSALFCLMLISFGDRRIHTRRGTVVLRNGTDKTVVRILFKHMRRPPGHAAHGK